MDNGETIDVAWFCEYPGDAWPFTGTYVDGPAAKWLGAFINGKASQAEVSQALEKAIANTNLCFESEYRRELEDVEAFEEMADDNGWLYFEDGTLYHA